MKWRSDFSAERRKKGQWGLSAFATLFTLSTGLFDLTFSLFITLLPNTNYGVLLPRIQRNPDRIANIPLRPIVRN